MPPTINTPTTTTFRWLLDTRPLWRDEPFEQSASRALALLPTAEQHAVLRHIFTADRKLRLASYLLKRLAVHRTLWVPWRSIVLSTDRHGKPCYVPDSPLSPSDNVHNPNVNDGADAGAGAGVVKFNVSHQAGLVVLIGSTDPAAEVGIDVVSAEERAVRDMAGVRKDGWAAWVEVYAEVFSPRELEEMKWTLPAPVSVPNPFPPQHNALGAKTGGDGEDDGKGYSDGTITLTPETLLPLSRCTRPGLALPLTLPVPVPLNSSLHTDPTSPPHTNPTPPPRTNPTQTLTVTISSTPLIASKLRNFYAHWCLKEAYIKMTGEALLAPWLREMEFRNVRPPAPSSSSFSTSLSSFPSSSSSSSPSVFPDPGQGSGEKEAGREGQRDGEGGGRRKGKVKWGETVGLETFEIYRSGERIGTDGGMRVELAAWEEGFMVGSAVSVSVGGGSAAMTMEDGGKGGCGIEFGEFEELELERDVLAVAEARG